MVFGIPMTLKPALVQLRRITESVVAADRDQIIDIQLFKICQYLLASGHMWSL